MQPKRTGVLVVALSLLLCPVAFGQGGEIELDYLGAVRAFAGTPQIYGGGLAYYPAGNGGAGSVFLSDAPGSPGIYELDIPAPVISSDIAGLNVATVLNSFAVSETAHSLAYRSTDDRLYYSNYPGVSAQYFRSINRDGTGESTRRSLSWGYVGRGLFQVPDGWTPAAGKNLLAVGDVRGIRLASVDPWNDPMGKTDVIYYDTTAHQMPGYEYPDQYDSAERVSPGTTANIVVAGKDASTLKAKLYFYRVTDIENASSTWEPVPYKVVEVEDLLFSGGHTLYGMAYDAGADILYGYEGNWDDPTVIHAWHTVEATDNPPTTIGDLAVSQATPYSVTLTWTSPSDDYGPDNAADSYDVRFAQSPIDPNNWDAATQCAGEPAPQPPGAPENFEVAGLTPDTLYYFAVRSSDGAGQISDLSNVASGSTEPEDLTPPAAVTDLSVSDVDSRKLLLNWTATGDDDMTGQAASYEVRASANPITEANFESAALVDQNLVPQAPGVPEALWVTGLDPNSTYYFALKVLDEIPNASDLSNVVAATTLPPDVTAPAAVSDLASPSAGMITIDLTWTAPGDDSGIGQAAEYDVRYSTDPITEGNWASSAAVQGEPAPQPAGSAEQFTIVGGVQPAAIYYIAIKTKDEEGNTSDLSNVISRTTLAAPEMPLVTSVTIHEKAGVTTANYPVTLSLGFARGDVADGVTARIAGQLVPTQTDVKVRYPDTSVKHALVSFVIPEMPASAQVAVDILDGVVWSDADYVAKAELLATDFEAAMDLTVDYVPTEISARQMLDDIADPEYWVKGPVCSELLIRDFDLNVAQQLNVQWRVRLYPGWDGMRIETVVENGWTEYRGNIEYDFALSLGYASPATVRQETGFTHNANARWRLVHWLGSEPPEIEVHYDLDYLIASGLLGGYDTSLVVPESTMAGAYSTWLTSSHDIMGSGIITTYFPMTGGRQDLGLLPTWAARYLLSWDNRMREVTLNCGDLSGSIPIHYRESDPNRSFYQHVMSIDDRPTIWAGWWDFSGTSPADALPPSLDTENTIWTVDSSHQPSLAYVPYLVTGDYYYLEEMYFWAGRNLAYNNWAYRGGDGSLGLLHTQDTRAQAWSLRNIADAANMAPDGDIEKPYFIEKTNNNIADYVDRFVINGLFPSIRYFKAQATTSRPDANLDPECSHYTSPWQDDFMMIVLGHMWQIGFDTGSMINWFSRSLIDRLTHPDYNSFRSAPYHIPTHYHDGQGGSLPYATWLDVNNAFVDDVGPSDFPDPDYAASYSYAMRSACAQVTHVPGGQVAWDWLDVHIHSKDTLTADPTWALIPGPVNSLADLNLDGQVGAGDWAIFVAAMNGPGQLPDWYGADLDIDGDCDLADFSLFAAEFGIP